MAAVAVDLETRRRRSRWVGGLAGALAAVVGTLAYLGWELGAVWMTSYVRGLPTQKPATAIVVLLCGAGLALRIAGRPRSPSSRLGAGLALLSTVVCVGILLERTTGLDTGFGWLGGVRRGVPVVQVVVAFSLLDLAIVTLHARGSWWTVGEVAGLGGLAIAVLALLGYLFDAPAMYAGNPTLPSEGMAIPTALAATAIGIGLQLARPDRGLVELLLRDDLGGREARRWTLPLLSVPALIALLVLGEHLGLYGPAEASALGVAAVLGFALANVVVHGRHLSRVGSALDRALAEAVAARDALAASEARVRSLVDQAPDGVFVADLQGRYTEVNDAGCRIVDQDRADLLGRTILEFIPPEEAPRLWAVRARILKGGVDVSEWRYRGRDGRYRPIEVSTTILPDGRWQAFVRDIGERIAAREADARVRDVERRGREDLLRLLDDSQAITEAVARLSVDGIDAVLRTVVQRSMRATGAAMGALGIGTEPGEPFEPWVHVGVAPDTVRAIGRTPRAVGTLALPAVRGEVLRVEDVHAHPAFRGLPPGHPDVRSYLAVPIVLGERRLGNLFLANKAGGPFTEADERVVQALAGRAASAIEIARLYEAEALQRGWLERVLDQIPEPVVIADEAGVPRRLNAAARALAVPDAAHASGHPLRLRAADRAELAPDEHPEVRAAVSGETLVGLELAIEAPDGTVVPVLASAAPVATAAGVRGAVVVLQDIRPIKELERLREEWSAIVAHDLRQPATTIGLTTDLLLRGGGEGLPAPVLDRLRTIGAASRQLRRLITDLLDVSRIEAHRLAVQPRALDVGELVRRVAGQLAVTLGDHELRIEAPAGAQAWADPGRVEQVLGNLLSNAAKYGAPGTPITVAVAPGAAEVTVSVTNLGAGLLPEEIPTLFSRFGRTARARASEAPGVGLGLFIAKGIVEAHGGRIAVESETGAATTFSFTLRAADPLAPG
jgi:PAS domain S-box-containing protein